MATGGSLSDAIQKIIDNVETAAEIAGNMCRLKAEQDFNKAAKQAVDYYYDYPVSSYSRKHHLYDIYKVNSAIKKRGKSYTITVSINMDSRPLDGVYYSHSSKHQGGGAWSGGGQVEGDYVFQNFLEGAHPWTYFENGEYVYGEDIQFPIPDQYLTQFINEYGPKYFEDYFQRTMGQLVEIYL